MRSFDRLLFFLVLAIGAAESRSTKIESISDPFFPSEYFAAAVPFLEHLTTENNLETLKALLLVIVYAISDASGPSINLWLYTGHAMRLAIELGLSRPSSAWSFTAQEEEIRRRIWWCTYRLERIVAVRLGRVLSIRNAGIDAEWSLQSEETTPACKILETPIQLNYRAGFHLVRLSRIHGDILESVYIARPVNRPSMTVEETLQRVWSIQNTLVEWANSITTISTPQSTDFNLLTLAFHRACLLLHRPSPSFPNQPESVHSVCIRSARAAINLNYSMLNNRALSRNWHTFHDSFLDGLILMFSSWASPTSTGAITILDQARDRDLENCSLVLVELSTCLPPSAQRYVNVFNKVVTAFERLVGIGSPIETAQEGTAEDFFFDWSIFEEMDGFELEQGAVEMIKTMTSGIREENRQ
ncbi:hypothetical protein JCM3765_000394 [Sporobolomyces pararoseus]